MVGANSSLRYSQAAHSLNTLDGFKRISSPNCIKRWRESLRVGSRRGERAGGGDATPVTRCGSGELTMPRMTCSLAFGETRIFSASKMMDNLAPATGESSSANNDGAVAN